MAIRIDDGGAILAARLAARTSLCLLERGREWVPGTFPDTMAAVVQELCTPQHPLGLYEYQSHDDMDVLVGCGLGGTSLINANVALEPDADVFDHARWPAEIRQDRDHGRLATYYTLAREMLQVERYPADQPPLRKSDAHRQSTEARGAPFATLDLAVNFTRFADQPNPVGVRQRLCTLCGDCVTGCNVRAKNTLYMNYLPLAKQRGAHLFTQIEVSHLVTWPEGGYVVHYTYGPGDGQPGRSAVLHARMVILAAGALGTPHILLRSRDYGLGLSETLGHYFSGNADVLGFGYNTDHQTDVLGFGTLQDERAQLRVGPTVVSMADYRQHPERSARFIIQEGAIPRALVDTLRYQMPVLARTGEDTDGGAADQWQEALRISRDLVGYDPQGALNHSMVYLGMGHDGADGTLVLDAKGRVRLLWANVREQPIFSTIDQEMRGHTAALGGTYVQNVTGRNGPKLITVHPVGGCIMGADAEHGVVDHRGRVYDPAPGTLAVHEGLFVADGSILPTAVGVNPLLTIAALAERIAALINQDTSLHWTPLDFDPTTYMAPVAPIGLEFTETMQGYVSEGNDGDTPEDFRQAARQGRAQGNGLRVWLWVYIENVDGFVQDEEHAARLKGYIEYPSIGGKRTIERGRLQLFVRDPQTQVKQMRFTLQVTDTAGQPYLLDGVNMIQDDPGGDVWQDTTTLFTTIYRGTSTDDPLLSRGIIRVSWADFLQQLASFRVHNAATRQAKQQALQTFGAFFFGELWETYGKPYMPGG